MKSLMSSACQYANKSNSYSLSIGDVTTTEPTCRCSSNSSVFKRVLSTAMMVALCTTQASGQQPSGVDEVDRLLGSFVTATGASSPVARAELNQFNQDSASLALTPNSFVRNLRAPIGRFLPVENGGLDSAARAHRFLSGNLAAFAGSEVVEFELTRSRNQDSRSYHRFQQRYHGLRVFGAAAVVQLNEAGVEYVVSDIARDFRSVEDGALSLYSPH